MTNSAPHLDSMAAPHVTHDRKGDGRQGRSVDSSKHWLQQGTARGDNFLQSSLTEYMHRFMRASPAAYAHAHANAHVCTRANTGTHVAQKVLMVSSVAIPQDTHTYTKNITFSVRTHANAYSHTHTYTRTPTLTSTHAPTQTNEDHPSTPVHTNARTHMHEIKD